MVQGDRYVAITVYLHKIPAIPHPWNKTCYVTITVYLHKTPVSPSPWNKAFYVMITVDRPSTSMIYDILKLCSEQANGIFHKLDKIGNNANIGIRGFTTWKQKIQ